MSSCIKCGVRPKKKHNRSWCSHCAKAYERKRWAKMPYWKKRERTLKKEYGITYRVFIGMLEIQDYRCATCRRLLTEQEACVDHCHDTGAIRGILCNHCNRALGLVYDNRETLKRMMEYLK